MQTTAPQTPFYLRNGHADTLFAKWLQTPPPPYRRELMPDSTGQAAAAYDFTDSPDKDAPLLVLFHGLEGSSRSHYASALMHAAHAAGWHGVVAHFRSCGGVPNRAPVFYHSGDSAEIAFMLDTLAQRYRRIYAAGVSLGGNALAKYLGEYGGRAVPRAAAAVSAPLDLTAAGGRFLHGATRLLYTRYFLSTLIPKARAAGCPEETLARIRTLPDFDDAFTAPRHGFTGSADYYRRASCKPLLGRVETPLLLINARNDPFLPPEALPAPHQVSSAVTLLQPPTGGHVGFVCADGGRPHIRWLPETLLAFFRQFEQAV